MPVTPEPADPLPVRIGRILLPREHGGWSLVLEPLALGLIAAPSAAGAAFGGAALSAFFLRRPTKLALGGGADDRRPLALGISGVLAVVAAAGVCLAVLLAGPALLWPLTVAVPAGAVFVWSDLRGEGREGTAEIAGATAFAVVPATLALAAGWKLAPATALAAVMACRSVPTVLTIRACLRRNKGQAVSAAPAVAASAAGLGVSVVLLRLGLAPWTAVLLLALLLVRAAVLLSSGGPRIRAVRIGLAEAVLGGILVVVVALGWSR